MNARFWAYIDGWVKLTVPEGAELSHRTYSTDVEGYRATYTTWTNEGGMVRRETYVRSRDCDGSYSYEYVDVCPMRDLAAVQLTREECGELPPALPRWTEKRNWQRDFTAEAMGY